MNKILCSIALLAISFSSTGQDSKTLENIHNFISDKAESWNLSDGDISQKKVSDFYRSGDILHCFLQQEFNGYKIENAIIGVHLKSDGTPFYGTSTFISNLGGKINTFNAQISALQASKKVLESLSLNTEISLDSEPKANNWVFTKNNELNDKVRVELLYTSIANEIKLVYAVLVYEKKREFKAMHYVDAISGEIIKTTSWTTNCEVKAGDYDGETPVALPDGPNGTQAAAAQSGVSDGSAYKVFEFPTESPSHGPRTLVEEPADPTASPFGWHDTDGNTGPEYTITRGNNLHAFPARDGNNSSQGGEPNGGSSLDFDYPYAPAPALTNSYLDAATVQLFYAMNTVHDITSNHGFDAASGNFQSNNYGLGGVGNDAIDAKAQSNLNNGEINNANYVHSPEGFSPTVNMYIWSDEGNGQLTINAPSGISGTYNTNLATFGASISSIPVTGDVVIAEDNLPNPLYTDACDDIQNDLTGKIAIVDRGGCEFGSKALAVQNAGAIACIICNFDDVGLNLGGGDDGPQVNIPVLMISNTDCNLIRQFAGVSLNASFVDPGVADTLDGDFDNGIIAHEYGHGISTRLTGGPTNSCLNSAEQMGEGWSDFFGLVFTTTPNHTGATSRGIGTYVSEETPAGLGIRRYPYSTDMSINPLTYGDLASSNGVHAIGEVWVTMVWEMYWALVDQYGWDPDLLNGTGGNNMALRLVIEGLKLQPCSPGFVDGRDAIIAADNALYNGDNICLIEAAFAKRGLGINASQGSSNSTTDGIENFDTNPLCIPELKLKKVVTEIINAGDHIDVSLTTSNHIPSTLTAVEVFDTIPNGLTYVAGSASIVPVQVGNLLTFSLGDMAYQDEIVITYELASDENIASESLFYDGVTSTSDDNIWEPAFYNSTSFLEWQLNASNFNSPSFSWYAQSVPESSDQTIVLQNPVSITGDHPSLKFWHLYDTEKGFDGGVVDYSLDGVIWQPLADYYFKNPHNANLDYQTFVIPNLTGFSGLSNGWIPSYADLDFLNGEDTYFRFRFGTDDSVIVDGWYVDDIEVLDLVSYNAGACAVASTGETACDLPEERGTLVNSEIDSTIVIVEPNAINELNPESFSVYPNPVNDILIIQNNETNSGISTEVKLYATDGRLTHFSILNKDRLELDLSKYASGIYHLQIISGEAAYSERIIKN